jgi:hypothetical protein
MADVRYPDVIKFGYVDFEVNDVKKMSTTKCKTCRAVIHETTGTTSAFVRHLSVAVHRHLREE